MRNTDSPDERLMKAAYRELDFYWRNIGESEDYRRWTARALITLGLFDYAEKVAPDDEEITATLAEVRRAIDTPDDEHCGCVHVVDGRVGEQHPERLMQIPNYVEIRQVFSPRHNCVVGVYECALCGHLNAHPFAPDALHATADSLRAQADELAREAIRLKIKHPQFNIQPDHAHAPTPTT